MELCNEKTNGLLRWGWKCVVCMFGFGCNKPRWSEKAIGQRRQARKAAYPHCNSEFRACPLHVDPPANAASVDAAYNVHFVGRVPPRGVFPRPLPVQYGAGIRLESTLTSGVYSNC